MTSVATAVVYAFLMWLALLIFMYALPHKPHYLLRTGVSLLLLCVASWIEMKAPIGVYVVCELTEITISTLMIYLCTGLKASTCCYCAIWAIIVTVAANEVWMFIHWTPNIRWLNLGVSELISATLFALPVYAILYFILARPLALEKNLKIGPRQLSCALLLWCIFTIEAYQLNHMVRNLAETEFYKLFPVIMIQLYCPVILGVQNVMFRRSAHEKEMQFITRLYEQQCSLYQNARKNVELIYRYSHDLKLRLAAVQKYLPEDFPQREWQEAKDAVAVFDRYVRTGNDVLDIVLTEKMLDCRGKKIQINAVIDGKALDFMDKADLYALFSCMLDGLIRFAMTIQTEQNRQIDLMVFTKHKFVIIHAIMDNVPKEESLYTTAEYKMLKKVAESYDGMFAKEETDGRLCVKTVLPARS